MYKDPHEVEDQDKVQESTVKKTDPQTDVYHNTEYVEKDTNMAIPTDDAVEAAKDWVDEENPR